MNKIMKIWILVTVLLLITPVAIKAYGVTRPLPYELELLRNEQGRFKFQIQIVPSEAAKSCTYNVKEGFPLQVSFQDQSVLLAPGQRKEIIGFVDVSRNANLGSYAGDICVSCVDSDNQAGTVVKQDVCDLPLKVNVVAQRTRDNMIIPVEEKAIGINKTFLIIASVVFLIGIISYVLMTHKPKKPKAATTTKSPIKKK